MRCLSLIEIHIECLLLFFREYEIIAGFGQVLSKAGRISYIEKLDVCKMLHILIIL